MMVFVCLLSGYAGKISIAIVNPRIEHWWWSLSHVLVKPHWFDLPLTIFSNILNCL